MKRFALLLASTALSFLLAACGGSSGSSADAPPDFKVVAGDGSVTISWTAEPEVVYWIFYGPGSNITTTNWSTTGGRVIAGATSPQVITGLINDSTYSFTINGRKNGGPGGSGAPTQVAVPRLSGANWAVNAPLGTATLRGISSGATVSGFAKLSVGDGGALYANIASGAATQPTNPASPLDINGACYATAGFVTVGANGSSLYSADAIAFTSNTTNTAATLNGCTSNGIGAYVAVGNGGALITATDGKTWAAQNTGTTADLLAAAYGNGLYVAVGKGGTIITSTDGATWKTVASGTTADLRGVAVGILNALTTPSYFYVAVGANGALVTSADGATWTSQAPISTRDLEDVIFGGQFVAVGAGGTILTSPDGLAWTARTSNTANDLFGVTRTLTGYSIVGAQGTNLTSF